MEHVNLVRVYANHRQLWLHLIALVLYRNYFWVDWDTSHSGKWRVHLKYDRHFFFLGNIPNLKCREKPARKMEMRSSWKSFRKKMLNFWVDKYKKLSLSWDEHQFDTPTQSNYNNEGKVSKTKNFRFKNDFSKSNLKTL
jgi:hypothetical protein